MALLGENLNPNPSPNPNSNLNPKPNSNPNPNPNPNPNQVALLAERLLAEEGWGEDAPPLATREVLAAALP